MREAVIVDTVRTPIGKRKGALAGWHPDRVRSLTAVSVPHPAAYTVAYRTDPEQKERSGYIRLCWQPGKAEEVLLADDGRRLRRMLSGGEGDSGVPAEAIDEYVAVLSAPGALTAALNWYRAMSSADGGARRGPISVISIGVIWRRSQKYRK